MGKKRKLDCEKLYKVSFKKKFSFLGKTFYPGKVYFIKGKYLKELLKEDAIEKWQGS